MTRTVCIIRQAIYPNDLLVRREAETLCQAGYETHVICLKRLEADAAGQLEETINSVHVHHLPLERKKTSTLRYLFDYFSFALMAGYQVTRLHFKRHLDIIQVNNMPDLLVFSTIIPKLLGTKVIAMMYEPTPEIWEDLRKTHPPLILGTVQRMALNFVDLSFTVTQQMKDVFVSRGISPEKIRVVLNAPEEKFLYTGQLTPPDHPKNDGFVLICHGAIEERYGLDTVLEAVSLARTQIPNLRLKILGKGTYVTRMLELRKQLQLEDCVEYLGYVPLDQMNEELQAATVGIVAQKSSSYSNLVHTGKMYDYIAFGKPIIASRLKATEAYFDDKALAYFEPSNAQSLANAIIDLYDHPEKGEEFVRNARELYLKYCWESQKEIYLSSYHELLS